MTLKKSGKVTLVGFGTFSVSSRKARTGRNPQTGAPLKIPAKKVTKFVAGLELKRPSIAAGNLPQKRSRSHQFVSFYDWRKLAWRSAEFLIRRNLLGSIVRVTIRMVAVTSSQSTRETDMLSLKNQIKVAVISVLTLSVFLTGCAKKSFVVKTVDDKVAPIDKRVTENSAAIKDNGERIDAVDRRATQGITAATTAATCSPRETSGAARRIRQIRCWCRTDDSDSGEYGCCHANQGVTAANTRIAAVDAKAHGGPLQSRSDTNRAVW